MQVIVEPVQMFVIAAILFQIYTSSSQPVLLSKGDPLTHVESVSNFLTVFKFIYKHFCNEI